MRALKMGLVSLVLLVTSAAALAGTDWLDWNEYDYSNSYNTYVYIDGGYVYGTVSWTQDYRHRWNSDYTRNQYNGQLKWSFVSADGTITGKYVRNWSRNYKRSSTYTYSNHYNLNFIKKGEGVIDTRTYKYHFTYDANGELKSYKWDYDW